MNYSVTEVDDDITSPQPQQEQQSTDQSPPSSAQITPLSSKGHSTWKCRVQQNKKQQKASNVPKKNAKGREDVWITHNSNNRLWTPLTHPPVVLLLPQLQRNKRRREDQRVALHLGQTYLAQAYTSNLKVFDPTSCLQFAWNDFRKLSKDELKTVAPPK